MMDEVKKKSYIFELYIIVRALQNWIF